MSATTTIKCPNCGTEINVNEILYHQLEDELKQKTIAEQNKLKAEVEAKRLEYKKAFDDLRAKEEAMKEHEAKYAKDLQKATEAKVEEQLRLERRAVEAELKAK